MSSEDDILIKPKTNLKETFSIAFSVLDLSRCLLFFLEAMKKWGEKVSTHIKIGEDAFALSTSLEDVNALITKYGGVKSLDYISAVYPDKFSISADFENKQLRVRANDTETLSTLRDMWNLVELGQTLSATDLRVSLLSEARRYILSCAHEDGSLTESGKDGLSFERSHIVLSLSDIDYRVIQDNFARHVLQSNNEGGGWGKLPNQPSTVTATASSLTFLSEARPEFSKLPNVMLEATRYLSGQRPNSNYHSDPEIKRSAELLNQRIILQFYQERSKEILARLRAELSKAKPSEIDHVTLRLLLKSPEIEKVIITDVLERFVGTYKSSYETSEFSDVVSLTTVLFAIKTLGTEKYESMYERALGDLLSLRNQDGGWPMKIGKDSTLSATLLAAATLASVLK